MAKAPDEFGKFLAKLRSDRLLTAADLARAINKSEDYIGGWERYPTRPINKQVLSQVSSALKLGEAERYELFRLADQRLGIETTHESLGWEGQVRLNVSQALAEIEHPSLDEVSKSGLMEVADVASWLFTLYGIRRPGTAYSPHLLRWPEPYRRAPQHRPPAPEAVQDIPFDLLKRELPNLPGSKPTEDIAWLSGACMASVYRSWLLADLDRCRLVTQCLRRWSVAESAKAGIVVTFIMRDVDDQVLSVPGVSGGVACTVLRRESASSLWEYYNARADELRWFPHSQDPVDSLIWPAFRIANFLYILEDHSPAVKQLKRQGMDLASVRQMISNATFVVSATAWDSPRIQRMVLPDFLAKDDTPKLAAALDAMRASANDDSASAMAGATQAKSIILDILRHGLVTIDALMRNLKPESSESQAPPSRTKPSKRKGKK